MRKHIINTKLTADGEYFFIDFERHAHKVSLSCFYNIIIVIPCSGGIMGNLSSIQSVLMTWLSLHWFNVEGFLESLTVLEAVGEICIVLYEKGFCASVYIYISNLRPVKCLLYKWDFDYFYKVKISF